MSKAPTNYGLLDTSVVIDLPELAPDTLPEASTICAISHAELSAAPLLTEDLQERAARQSRLQKVEADFSPIAFDDDCARAFGKVAADLRRNGRKYQARSFDALIAATAIAYGLPLYTMNPDDFTVCKKLRPILVQLHSTTIALEHLERLPPICVGTVVNTRQGLSMP